MDVIEEDETPVLLSSEKREELENAVAVTRQLTENLQQANITIERLLQSKDEIQQLAQTLERYEQLKIRQRNRDKM